MQKTPVGQGQFLAPSAVFLKARKNCKSNSFANTRSPCTRGVPVQKLGATCDKSSHSSTSKRCPTRSGCELWRALLGFTPEVFPILSHFSFRCSGPPFFFCKQTSVSILDLDLHMHTRACQSQTGYGRLWNLNGIATNNVHQIRLLEPLFQNESRNFPIWTVESTNGVLRPSTSQLFLQLLPQLLSLDCFERSRRRDHSRSKVFTNAHHYYLERV
jgi:hypothetical protein